MSRKTKDARHGYMLRVRLNREEQRAIERLAEKLSTTVSEVVRQLIRRAAGLPVTYDELKDEK